MRKIQNTGSWNSPERAPTGVSNRFPGSPPISYNRTKLNLLFKAQPSLR